MARLDGKVALVTGGAGGIGLGIAKRFREEGANVIVTDVNAKGEEVVGVLGAEFIHHDVADEANWQAVVETVVRKYNRLDILANNGATECRADPEDVRMEDWRRLFAVNAESVVLGCKTAIPAIARSGGGAIVNTASLIAHIAAPPGFYAYGASKASVLHMTRSIALYCARKGYAIRCNSVSAGQVITPAMEKMWSKNALDDGRDRQLVIDEDLTHIPLGRFQEPVDLANAVLFLASDEARYITGINVIVDGGMELVM
jgi:3(or 17)beta-hydroxysteroid dehydrogenase